jgi:hypothetical protein
MKRFLPLILILLGITLIFLGFVYDVLFAGIPYQDPTPALTTRYDFHSRIASIIRWSGVGICVIGGLVGLIRRLRRKGQVRGN